MCLLRRLSTYRKLRWRYTNSLGVHPKVLGTTTFLCRACPQPFTTNLPLKTQEALISVESRFLTMFLQDWTFQLATQC